MPDRGMLAKRREEEEREYSHEFKPTEVQIERMISFLDDRYSGVLDAITRPAQKAIGAAGVAYGYEAAAKMLDAVSKMPEVKYEGRPKEKTRAVMEGIKEMPSQQQSSAVVTETCHFAWSYYNKELGKEVVTETKTELARTEFEEGEEEKRAGQRHEDDERPMAMRVGHKGRAQVGVEPELVYAQQQKQIVREEEKKKEEERAKLEAQVRAGTTAQKVRMSAKPKIVDAKEEKGQTSAAAAINPDDASVKEAKKAVLLAASKEKVAPVLEYVLKQEIGEESKKDLKLLEVDEKRLAVAEKMVDEKIAELKKETAFLEKNRDEKKKEKLRALKRKMAFWNKAKGALRRLSGGFFGSVGKMIGGIFR